MDARQQYGQPFSAFQAVLSGGSVTAVQAAGGANDVHYLTDIAASTDLPFAQLYVIGGAKGTLWQLTLAITGTAQNIFSHQFRVPLVGTAGGSMSLRVDGTGTARACMTGYTITK